MINVVVVELLVFDVGWFVIAFVQSLNVFVVFDKKVYLVRELGFGLLLFVVLLLLAK